MRAMIDRSPDGIKLHVIAHDGRESRIMDDSEGIIDVAIVSDKTGPMIATKPDGSTWVSYEDYIVITADNARLQAEVERLEELFRLAVERFNDAEKLVIHKDEQLVAMTARCKAAEELLVESKDTILYIKQYVDGQGLSAEDDGDNMIKAINDFLGVI